MKRRKDTKGAGGAVGLSDAIAAPRLLFQEDRAKADIGRLVRSARERAAMSQRELAARARTTQAVVARLELGNDQRMPSLSLISRLLDAAGAQLELVCRFGLT